MRPCAHVLRRDDDAIHERIAALSNIRSAAASIAAVICVSLSACAAAIECASQRALAPDIDCQSLGWYHRNDRAHANRRRHLRQPGRLQPVPSYDAYHEPTAALDLSRRHRDRDTTFAVEHFESLSACRVIVVVYRCGLIDAATYCRRRTCDGERGSVVAGIKHVALVEPD